MTLYHQAPDCTFYVGDVLDVLASLAPKSVHTVVTSPPYFGLRDYGIAPSVWGGDGYEHEWGSERPVSVGRQDADRLTAGLAKGNGGGTTVGVQLGSSGSTCSLCGAWRGVLGLEPVPDCLGWSRNERCNVCFICHLLTVFDAVKRVLRDDGQAWINISDSYTSGGRANFGPDQMGDKQHSNGAVKSATRAPQPPGLAPKNRVGIPERFALAMQAAGWIWRDSIHLCKSSPMPESVTDRTTQAHESLFLFTKKARYFWDQEAVREKFTDERMGNPGTYNWEYSKGSGRVDKGLGEGRGWNTDGSVSGRNPRSWMIVNPEPSSIAHYATFVGGRTIPSFAIRAGSSEYGCCSVCLNPWERMTESTSHFGKRITAGMAIHKAQGDLVRTTPVGRTCGNPTVETLGWRPTCSHAAERVPATILDIFSGSGTTQVTARQLGRRSIYVDLSEKYADIAIKRLEQVTPTLPGLVSAPQPAQLALEASG